MSTNLSYEEAMSTDWKKDLQKLKNKLTPNVNIIEAIKKYGKLSYDAGVYEKESNSLEKTNLADKQFEKILSLLKK